MPGCWTAPAPGRLCAWSSPKRRSWPSGRLSWAWPGKRALAVLVLDEVGLGGVGAHPAVRHFADLNGRLNQAACAQADEVYAVQAGLAQRLK